jgi:hypothetical protein
LKNAIKLITVLFSLQLLAHGEDTPGPHGGYIRMPGLFHTEVVQEKNGYRVYLLDIAWKNPTVLDSSIKAFIENGSKKSALKCRKDSESYFCISKDLQSGQLKISAQRKGQTGALSVYDLPLKFEAPNNAETSDKKMENKSHH